MVQRDVDYWDARYANGHNSGDGSYGEALTRKLDWLSTLPDIGSITEVGCGDFNFGENLLKRFPAACYIGTDTSKVIVERNRAHETRPGVTFLHDAGVIPDADLILCIDVLFHITEDREYEALLGRLESARCRYLALTAYEYDGLRQAHIAIRKFDPSRFGTPILREIAEEDGTLCLYVWKR